MTACYGVGLAPKKHTLRTRHLVSRMSLAMAAQLHENDVFSLKRLHP
jgi:hypothetical protein